MIDLDLINESIINIDYTNFDKLTEGITIEELFKHVHPYVDSTTTNEESNVTHKLIEALREYLVVDLNNYNIEIHEKTDHTVCAYIKDTVDEMYMEVEESKLMEYLEYSSRPIINAGKAAEFYNLRSIYGIKLPSTYIMTDVGKPKDVEKYNKETLEYWMGGRYKTNYKLQLDRFYKAIKDGVLLYLPEEQKNQVASDCNRFVQQVYYLNYRSYPFHLKGLMGRKQGDRYVSPRIYSDPLLLASRTHTIEDIPREIVVGCFYYNMILTGYYRHYNFKEILDEAQDFWSKEDDQEMGELVTSILLEVREEKFTDKLFNKVWVYRENEYDVFRLYLIANYFSGRK